MNSYEPQKIEKKWQERWEKEKLYQAKDFDKKSKFYTLIEFPYPSGAGLHVGHVRSWAAMDAFSRKKRMQGLNVLYPIGWDAFGLPAENYALKMGLHPSQTVAENIQRFKNQCQSLGLSFDWSREINTTDPKYYKWTQWIFLKLLEKGLAFRAKTPVNWCPSCKTTLADEEVMPDGTHERCGNPTEKRQQEQWLLKITQYAERLLQDLDKVDYSSKIRVQQENWIGKSEGTQIEFKIEESDYKISVFTTRADTIFGVTALVVAPEHGILTTLKDRIKNPDQVNDYLVSAKKKNEIERMDVAKEKTGVPLNGISAINPLSSEKIPVWVGDYVIGSYGGGAVMVVPAHDKRDGAFAKNYHLPVKKVVLPPALLKIVRGATDVAAGAPSELRPKSDFYTGYGELVDSGEFTGLKSEEAIVKITNWLEKNNQGRKAVTYRLRDWIFSRQHYWGEPIPIVYCDKCGAVPVPEKDLPVELPFVEKYEPSGTGESPLAKIADWVNTKCPKCAGPARRETDTMPNWAGSNWYFLRYLDRQNDKELAAKDKIQYWMPVDIYQGGFEHTTLHLLYSRFIHKFLYDIGAVNTPEPYAKRRSHGIVLGPDNRKMSKSFGNVVNPDEIVEKYGADTLRLYEMFMGPFDQAVAWSEKSLQGCFRFLNRVWQLFQNNVKNEKTPEPLVKKLHQTIKKVSQDLDELKFNTLVASLMEFINDWSESYLSREDAEIFVKILSPAAPHFAEEIWCQILKNKFSVHQQAWPKFDAKMMAEDTLTIVVQVAGKVRGQVTVDSVKAIDQKEIEELAKKDSRVSQYLKGKEIKKVFFVPGKLINFVV